MKERTGLFDDTLEKNEINACIGMEEFGSCECNSLDSVIPLSDPGKEIIQSKLLLDVSKKIMYTLLRKLKSVIIIEGDLGSGRKTAVEFTERLIEEKSSSFFDKIIFLKVDMSSLLGNEDDIISFFNDIIQKYQKEGYKKFVFYLGDFNSIPSIFTTDFFNIKSKLEALDIEMLKFILIKEKEKSSCECNGNTYSMEDSGLSELELIRDALIIENPNELDYSQMAKNLMPTVWKLEEEHDVKCSEEIVEKLILILATKNSEQDVTYYDVIHRIDALMAVAKLESNREDSEVTEECFKMIFDDDYKVYDSTSEITREHIAKHEIGHTILMLSLGENRYKVMGVKIIYDNCSGNSGISYAVENICIDQDREFIKEKIAVLLAGRLSEGGMSRGAEVDFEIANEIARNYVTENGWVIDGAESFVISPKDICLTDSLRNRITKKVVALLEEAKFIAIKTLHENQPAADEMVQELLKCGLLTKKQIYDIWNKHKSK